MQYRSPRALYNDIGRKYHDNREKASNDVTELPTVLKLLGDLRGKKVLDMGCGLGKHAKEFIKRGAVVTGYDASERMVLYTKDYCNGKGTFFRSTHETASFEPNSFDSINASLTIHYSTKLDTIFNNMHKWLKPNGIVTFSIMHPLWYFQRVNNANFSRPNKMWFRIPSYDVELFNYYYPLSTYIDLINKHNFSLRAMVETTIPRRYKGWREDKYRLPNSIVFKLQKN